MYTPLSLPARRPDFRLDCRKLYNSRVTRLVLAIGGILVASAWGQDAPKHLQAGSDLLQRGNVEAAIREFRAALAADPQYGAAHMRSCSNIGNVLAMLR